MTTVCSYDMTMASLLIARSTELAVCVYPGHLPPVGETHAPRATRAMRLPRAARGSRPVFGPMRPFRADAPHRWIAVRTDANVRSFGGAPLLATPMWSRRSLVLAPSFCANVLSKLGRFSLTVRRTRELQPAAA